MGLVVSPGDPELFSFDLNKRILIRAVTLVAEAVFANVVECERALAAASQFLLSTRIPHPASIVLVVCDAPAEEGLIGAQRGDQELTQRRDRAVVQVRGLGPGPIQ